MIYNIFGEHSPIITIALVVMMALLLLMVIIITYILSKQHQRMYRFFGGKARRRNLEIMLDDYLDKVQRIEDKYDEVLALTDDINARMITCIRKVAVMRYNPFEDMGGDHSFVIALLDENDDGVVISSIYNRESSHTYAKQIYQGSHANELTAEEIEVIQQALEGKPIVDLGEHRAKRERRIEDLKKRQERLDQWHMSNVPEPMDFDPTSADEPPKKHTTSRKRLALNRKRILAESAAESLRGLAQDEHLKKRLEELGTEPPPPDIFSHLSKRPVGYVADIDDEDTKEVPIVDNIDTPPNEEECQKPLIDETPEPTQEELDNLRAIERLRAKLKRENSE